ncbi:MAG: hypothetical protein JO027_10000 [Solirubrobacterales bacterium]|nr:hypothetical protein [Solirubrobacterales bacterium]
MAGGEAAAPGALPELAAVHWRRRADEDSLRRAGRLWTLSTVAHTVPFVAAALVLGLAAPILLPFAVLCLVHAWAIPELYAARGARVLKPVDGERGGSERVALGLLGDLVDHGARELHGRSGLMLESGRLGVWLVGEAGALLVRPGGRRVHCYCVRATGPGLPPSDRLAHLLLALRTDEPGFATVANLAFSGARWRVRRRLRPPARLALDVAAPQSRAR